MRLNQPRSGVLTRLLQLVATLSLLSVTTACTTLTGGTEHARYIDSSCTAFQNITYSVHDTDQTVAQIRGHNAAYDSLCKGRE